MQSRKILIAALVAAAMTIPTSVVAEWRSSGESEPNTALDVSSGLMWQDTDTSKVCVGAELPPVCGRERIYFQAIPKEGTLIAGEPSVNPNVGALHTRIIPHGAISWYALLGVWKDCNKDGYIGNAETALQDYLAVKQVVGTTTVTNYDANVCPVQSWDPSKLPVHNDGKWIREFIAIAMPDPCTYQTDRDYRTKNCTGSGFGTGSGAFTKNPDVIYSNNTFLWLDTSAPGKDAPPRCPLRPQPYGTTSGTGAFLFSVDCSLGHFIGRTVNTVAGVNPLLAPLAFSNPDNTATSTGALNQQFPVNLFGNPYNGRTGIVQPYNPKDSRYHYDPTVSFDCTGAQPTRVNDPTAPAPGRNGTLNQVGVKDPEAVRSTPVGDTGKTQEDYLGASANFTDSSGKIVWIYPSSPHAGGPSTSDPTHTGSAFQSAESAYDTVDRGTDYRQQSDCDHNTNNSFHGNGANFLLIEDAWYPSTIRTENSGFFAWFSNGRGLVDRKTDDTTPAGQNFPGDLGIGVMRQRGEGWLLGVTQTATQDVADRNNNLAPPEAIYYTSYARVDPTLSGYLLPPGAGAVYGTEACTNGIFSGALDQNGWACDPDKWYKAPDGSSTMPYYSDTGLSNPANRTARGHIVGESYDLRDVDCFDGFVAPGVYAATTPLNKKGPCV